MKNKLTITKDNYKEIVLKRAIITCWILLIICFIVKICGGNFFNIVFNNDKFIKICDYIDKSAIQYLIHFIFFTISLFFILKSIDFGVSKTKTIIKLFMCIALWSFKHLVNIGIISINLYLYDFIDFAFIYLISVFIHSDKVNNKQLFLKPAIYLILLFIFTLITSVTKNIGYNTLNNSFLVGIIFMIDYYIMILLTYLYSKRRYLKWVNGDCSTG